jgi:hypothetical protein
MLICFAVSYNIYHSFTSKTCDTWLTVVSPSLDSFYGYSALSCLTDWTFSIVPIFIVQNLQMSKRKRISVAVVLAFCAL